MTKEKSKDKFKEIKNDYILKKIFLNLKNKKFMEIIKYNKKLQKRLKVNINDYKEYSQLYSSIEIELIIEDYKYGRFINIDEEEKKYYHIYFDNSKEEIRRDYLKENEKVKMIKIIIDFQVKSFRGLFYYCDCISSIVFKKFYRKNIIDMGGMFFYCTSLKILNLSNFNTNNITNMSSIFFGCSSLKELNISNFNTNNVTDMSFMFYRCSSLKRLNLFNFNTNNVIDMKGMFGECSSLKELNISNLNVNGGNNMTNIL